tara:strand:+ start:726 stop:1520 length:795 start_codon:yes stop_codon:yes gene_type:complete
MIINLEKKQTKICVDENINKTIFVCSHERSGTHFLMNSIATNSNYTAEPYLNFDLIPLGDTVNFFSASHVKSFVDEISNIKHQNKRHGLSSLIKSHHPSYIFEELFNNQSFFFFYIYRDPVETLLSFWKFIHHWNWHEGPKLDTPLKFVKTEPEGQMQRYQKKSYINIFLRWLNHVLEWVEASKKFKNIYLVSYKKLNLDFNSTIIKIMNLLEIPFNKIIKPPKNNYINTVQLKLSSNDRHEFVNYIEENLSLFPEIKKIIREN